MVLFLTCLCLSGCKTSKDATAAANQLIATAQSLTDYYNALGTIATSTDRLNSVQVALYNIPYDDAVKAQIVEARTEIQKRAAVAKGLTDLAKHFAMFTGSTPAADASASAGKLEDEVKTLETSDIFPTSSPEIVILNNSIGAIVRAIQENKKREVAKSVGEFAQALNNLFATESAVYVTLNIQYVTLSSSLAKRMLQEGKTDPTSFLALSPYALTPEIASHGLKNGVTNIAATQVDKRAATLTQSQKDASENMWESLNEMAARINLVANDKPMLARTAPVTLTQVEKWASQFASTTAP
jgi:hypothetical protein